MHESFGNTSQWFPYHVLKIAVFVSGAETSFLVGFVSDMSVHVLTHGSLWNLYPADASMFKCSSMMDCERVFIKTRSLGKLQSCKKRKGKKLMIISRPKTSKTASVLK